MRPVSEVRPRRDPSCDSQASEGISFMTRHNLIGFKELAVTLRKGGVGGERG